MGFAEILKRPPAQWQGLASIRSNDDDVQKFAAQKRQESRSMSLRSIKESWLYVRLGEVLRRTTLRSWRMLGRTSVHGPRCDQKDQHLLVVNKRSSSLRGE